MIRTSETKPDREQKASTTFGDDALLVLCPHQAEASLGQQQQQQESACDPHVTLCLSHENSLPLPGTPELLSTEKEGVSVPGNRCPTLTHPHTGYHSR